MQKVEIEFTNDTLVMTTRGPEKLTDILNRSVRPCLWAIKWCICDHIPNGMSFHNSHKAALEFAYCQLDSRPDGHARLVAVSDEIMSHVQSSGYCWANLNDFDAAEKYKGTLWSH